jgi:hypothetical protein
MTFPASGYLDVHKLIVRGPRSFIFFFHCPVTSKTKIIIIILSKRREKQRVK